MLKNTKTKPHSETAFTNRSLNHFGGAAGSGGLFKMPTITITGDTTHEALEELINQGIARYGYEFKVLLSPNLKFIKNGN